MKKGINFDPVLICTALLATLLNIFNIWNGQNANAYYTAAVTSMLQSWHNFFYASLDPAGYVTVDKPPVVFWIQTLFAYIFGVHAWSVILPQALAGVGSVLLIYLLVKPAFGKTAARLAGLITACTPIPVAVSRTNNIDSLLVFTLLFATWMLFRGISRQKLSLILGSFAVIGVGFNMKMLQAYMVLPAFYLFYLIACKNGWKKKLAVLAAASVLLVGVSVSYAVAVDLVPEDDRPYIGGSQTNSVLELAFGYNGIQRLRGMTRGGPGPGGGAAPDQRRAPNEGVRSEQQGVQSDGNMDRREQAQLYGSDWTGRPQVSTDGNSTTDRQQIQQDGNSAASQQQIQQDGNTTSGGLPVPPDGNTMSDQPPQDGNMPGGPVPPDGNSMPEEFTSGYDGKPGQLPGGGGPQGQGGGMFGTGQAGPLRLFQSELSGQVSWLLPFVAFSCVGLLAGVRLRSPLTDKQQETLFWLSWLIPGMVFFSIAGFFHHYYLIMLAPPIAALAGAGWVELWSRYREQAGWQKWLLPAGLLAATTFELYIIEPYQNQIGPGWSIAIGAAGAGLALVLVLAPGRQKLTSIAAMAGILVLLAAPLYWATTPLIYGDNYVMPQAGFSQQGFGQRQGMMGGAGPGAGSGINTRLLDYVTRNNTGEKILFATTEASTAESYIIETGQAVIAMGGFSGSDPILTAEKVQEMVADHEVKFFLLPSGSAGGGRGGSSEVLDWIRANSTEVPAEEWQPDTARGDRQGGRGIGNDRTTLYQVNL